ncbi:MAG: crossover junction endodeoxyribonuclease RuvC [Phycisphaerae bacterium]
MTGMEICGIDPGLETSGYAVLTIDDDGGAVTVRDAGVCRTDAGDPLAQRLARIEADFCELLGQFRPDAVGVEQLYAHYKHPRTAILMGHARGVILAVAARLSPAVHDFSATQVKRYMTGNGRASKAQMQRSVMSALGLIRVPEPNDVADALAVALCCAHQCRNPRPTVCP